MAGANCVMIKLRYFFAVRFPDKEGHRGFVSGGDSDIWVRKDDYQ